MPVIWKVDFPVNRASSPFRMGLVSISCCSQMPAMAPASASEHTLRLAIMVAVALPLVWVVQRAPLPAFFSQCLACGLWAVAVTLGALQHGNTHSVRSAPYAVPALWCLLLVTTMWHWLLRATPGFLLLPVALNLLLAGLISWQVVVDHDAPRVRIMFHWLTSGILIAAIFNAVAAITQMVAPSWANDTLIAVSAGVDERATGNLRQPNQLATLMVWGIVAATHLLWSRRLLWAAVCTALLAALLASGSRTGVLSLLILLPLALLALWPQAAPAQRSRPRERRQLLLAILALACVIALLAFAAVHVFGRATADASLAQRLALWQQTVALIQQHPWTGVGWSQLNFAWTLAPFNDRAPDVFDHAHNLLLHLAVELGVPVTIAVIALLLRAIWPVQTWKTALSGRNRGCVLTAASLLVAIAVHSSFEYPLWYSYFLLPTAFLLAVLAKTLRAREPDGVRSTPAATAATTRSWPLATAGAFALGATLWSALEYAKVSAIHFTGNDVAARSRAVDAARASPLYGQYGDYAAIMLAGDRAPLEWFARPVRTVLDERLLTAWARALERAGQHERAAWVVARAREFPPDPAFAELPVVTAPLNPASAPRSAADFR